MANPLLVAIAKFVRDVLTHDEALIRIGRLNWEQDDPTTGYIVVDALAPQRRTATLESYDGDTEVLSLGHMWRGTVTLDFYGDGAYDRAELFCLMCKSQAAYELKKSLGLDIHQPNQITDVAALTGQQYGERIQVELVAERCATADIDTLRIDTAQVELRNEDGIIYDG